jgi:parallel beta-helix repeat protein
MISRSVGVVSALVAWLALAPSPAAAFPGTLNAWQQRYGAQSPSGDNAACQLCHAAANGGSPWNGYGWDLRLALEDPACDFDADGTVSNEEAFFCIEPDNSDGDATAFDNLTEIGAAAQPGWVEGPFNTLYSRSGTTTGQLPPDGIGKLDPDGSEPPPPPPPPPGQELSCDPWPQHRHARVLVVQPGQSLQAAIECARYGARIFVLPGTYRETADPTNGLNITRSGVRLIGLGTKKRPVVFENAGNQRNGIVAVPDDRTDCMRCHSDMTPPFPLKPDVPHDGLKMREPMMTGLEIRNITIRGFKNNGLFTENVDGFQIVNVRSEGNRNYGIFPTLSKNGIILNSYASGSEDSGIWVETSENVRVIGNLVEDNVNGFEVSNSDDILLAFNEARNNTVGMAILLLPDIFDDRAGAKRIDMKHNWIHDNNKPNTARPGSILASVPSGLGILHLGVDDSEISHNRVERHDSVGIAVADYCLAVIGTPFACGVDPTTTPEFVMDSFATNNRVTDNVLIGNGTNPDPNHPFAFAAGDLALLTLGDAGNCYERNIFSTFFSLIGVLPPCD